MAEWLYEAGIGEARAALVENGVIVEARLELEGNLPLGTIAEARRRGDHVVLDDGREAMLDRVPPRLSEGAALLVEIVREAIPEPGRAKRPRAIPAAPDARPAPGPDLLARITATNIPIRLLRAHESDALEAAGWSELLDEAETGEIGFGRGALRLSPTPAMTLFDVDGAAPLLDLAIAGAIASARTIRRLDIGGSIGIDLPTLGGKAERQRVAEAIDATLPQPFERTAMNGFGFLQIVRPRPRASLVELLRADPAGAIARAALRTIERTPPPVPPRHILPAPALAWLDARPHLVAELARRTGVPIQFASGS
ncbi:ribonuclease [Hephaestia sp. GCM10023244]|uniref:ribonuclease n=1 Tax=unclassified Hephaestia TaxID=2631281 RepID=UPI0020774B0F|nr:ribonuclease [Hephaestia sp. MAHUQ-44]MCM8729892.1 ribonuclease [Hephaestia sp. MAHUQ-44]